MYILCPKIMHWADTFTPLTNSITCYSIVVESCSNPQTWQVFESAMKKTNGFGFQVFCEWPHNWGSFTGILAHVIWPRVQPLDRSILLKFPLETRLESQTLEPLIDFLTFLVQKLWLSNKSVNYLIMGSLLLFLGHNFWTLNSSKSSKILKD